MVLPTFLIVGAQKAGTTSLWAYLRAHPGVFMSRRKELNFFSVDPVWELGLDWYRGFFAEGRSQPAIGEASPSYSNPEYEDTTARIAATLPTVRLVFVVRDPIERIRAAYLHAVAEGTEHRPVHEAVFDDRLYLGPSRYGLVMQRFLEHVERERILVLRSEDLRARTGELFADVCRFVGVDASLAPANLDQRYHQTDEKRVPRPWARRVGALLFRAGLGPKPGQARRQPPRWVTRPLDPSIGELDDELRARLTEILHPDLLELREILGPDFDAWGLLDSSSAAE